MGHLFGMLVPGLLAGAWLLNAHAALAEESPLAIKVEAPKVLRLSKKGYQGKIKVTILNRGREPVTVHHGEENYLIFEGADGKLDLICHPCACMVNSDESKEARGPFSATLEPGGKKELVFDDWGCGGGPWRGPAAGSYQVTYRVFLERHRHVADPHRCCDGLREAAFWQGALVSPLVKLKIVGEQPK